jgi:hypothetical protein
MNKFVVFAILLMLLGTVGAAGCVDSNRNSTQNPTTNQEQGLGHNATLERFVNITKQSEYGNKSKEVVAWLVTWNNDSSVTILETVKNRTDNSSASSNSTLISFPSTEDATNYMNGLDKSDFSLISTSYKTSDAPTLTNVTEHVPSVYTEYVKTEGSIFDLTFKATMLMQYDNIIGIVSAKLLSFGSGGGSASSNHTSPIPVPIPIPSVTPKPSPTPTGTPTPTPTPTPEKTATSIQFTSPSVRKGQSLGINVISSASGQRICTPGLVTATIGTVTSGGSDCYSTAFLNTGSLNPGTYDVTLKFAGDITYQPSQSTIRITITA